MQPRRAASASNSPAPRASQLGGWSAGIALFAFLAFVCLAGANIALDKLEPNQGRAATGFTLAVLFGITGAAVSGWILARSPWHVVAALGVAGLYCIATVALATDYGKGADTDGSEVGPAVFVGTFLLGLPAIAATVFGLARSLKDGWMAWIAGIGGLSLACAIAGLYVLMTIDAQAQEAARENRPIPQAGLMMILVTLGLAAWRRRRTA